MGVPQWRALCHRAQTAQVIRQAHHRAGRIRARHHVLQRLLRHHHFARPTGQFQLANALMAAHRQGEGHPDGRSSSWGKCGEKLVENEENLLEHRTDGTDAFDILYIGCEKFPYRDTFSLNSGGVLLNPFAKIQSKSCTTQKLLLPLQKV